MMTVNPKSKEGFFRIETFSFLG